MQIDRAAPAGGGVEPAGRARGGARPRVSLRAAAAAAERRAATRPARSASRQLEQTDTALRTAEANLKALQAQVQQQEVQLRFFTITAPTAGIVGDVPVRVGSQVTTQTLLTTIDQNDTLEVNVVGADRARRRARRSACRCRCSSSDGGQRIATTTVSFVSPHVDDQTQSVLVKGMVQESATARCAPSQYVRARIVWKTADGLVVPVTAVLRVNGQFFAFVAEPAAGGRADARSSARSRSARSSATTIRCSTASSPASASSCRARRSWPTARRSSAAGRQRRSRQPPALTP